jgi:(p)ppGpp synthase/HD superfamily hydrolase
MFLLPMKIETYDAALAYATAAHAGQVRKGTSIPYITHPVAVAALVREFGGDHDQIIAALLHDVVEDCGITIDKIESRFGPRIASIVDSCTDGIPDNTGNKAAWRLRKETYIHHLLTADTDTLLVSVCDKIHNARCIRDDLAAIGPDVFDRFTAGYEGTRWYYDALLEVFETRLGPAAPVVIALRDALEKTYVASD